MSQKPELFALAKNYSDSFLGRDPWEMKLTEATVQVVQLLLDSYPETNSIVTAAFLYRTGKYSIYDYEPIKPSIRLTSPEQKRSTQNTQLFIENYAPRDVRNELNEALLINLVKTPMGELTTREQFVLYEAQMLALLDPDNHLISTDGLALAFIQELTIFGEDKFTMGRGQSSLKAWLPEFKEKWNLDKQSSPLG